jgi:hypothetical protein
MFGAIFTFTTSLRGSLFFGSRGSCSLRSLGSLLNFILCETSTYFYFSTLRSSFYFSLSSRLRLNSRTFSASCFRIAFFLSTELPPYFYIKALFNLANFSLSILVSCSDPNEDELPLLLELDELLASFSTSIFSFSELSDA